MQRGGRQKRALTSSSDVDSVEGLRWARCVSPYIIFRIFTGRGVLVVLCVAV